MNKRNGTVDRRRAISAQAEEMARDLSSIRRALRKPFEAEIAKGNLTVPQTGVMQVVVRSNGISLKDLSHTMSLAHSTVSGIVDRLEKRGMIERRPDETDKRISRIYPTEAVSGFVRDQIPALTRGPLEAALERASDAERAKISTALQRLRELLESVG
jgi:DNA-binding MarR family transcriptional regulator